MYLSSFGIITSCHQTYLSWLRRQVGMIVLDPHVTAPWTLSHPSSPSFLLHSDVSSYGCKTKCEPVMPLTSSASLMVIDFSLSSGRCSAQTTQGCWCWKTIFKRTDAQNSNSSKEMHFPPLGFSIPQLFYVNIYPPHLKTNAQMPKMFSLSLPLSLTLSLSPCKTCTVQTRKLFITASNMLGKHQKF